MTFLHRLNQGGPWRRFRRSVWLKSILLGCVLVGAKWGWIARNASEVPYMDQWDAEAEYLIAPILRGEFTWDLLLRPHNEHRIVATKAWNAAWFELASRQWDPLLETVSSALVHAAFFVLLAAWCARRLSPRWHPALFLLLAALGALPFGYENMLWGFQSQIYFMLLFGLLAGQGLIFFPAGSPRWCLGVAAGVAATLSFGSGGLVGAAVVAAVAIRSAARRRWTWRDLPTLAVGAALPVLTWMIKASVPGHHLLAADSWSTFSLAALRLLSWPNAAGLLSGFLVWVPPTILIVHLLSGRRQLSSLALMAVFLAMLAAAVATTLAVFRAADVLYSPASARYLDLLAPGLIGSLLATLFLWTGRPSFSRRREVLAIGWLACALIGLGGESWSALFGHVNAWREHGIAQRDALREFIRTDDVAQLSRHTMLEIGYPDPQRLAMILRRPELRPALPAVLQGNALGLRFPAGTGFRPAELPPAMKPPRGLTVWTNHNATHALRVAESEPFTIGRNHVEFLLGVSPDGGGIVNFEFVPTTGPGGVALQAWGIPGGEVLWESVRVELAPGEYRLRVSDPRPQGWSAVTAPREIATVAVWARAGLGWSPLVTGLGVLGLAMTLSWPLLLSRGAGSASSPSRATVSR